MLPEKEHINNMRFAGLIKGNRPFICMMSKSSTAFFKRSLKYIISYKDSTIYFQSLNYFTEEPNNKFDYAVNIKSLKDYSYSFINKQLMAFTLRLNKKGYITLLINQNVKKRIYSQVEFNDFKKYLENNGIKDSEENEKN